MRALVVEDERRLADHISQSLAEQSFAVDCVHDGASGFELAREIDYDVIVLDMMLPGMHGLTFCEQLRKNRRSTPVLILSGKGLVEDRVRGLDAGADDYLVKPFSVQELHARIRALLRRRDGGASPRLRVGTLELDPAKRTVTCAGRPVPLTAKEFALLEYLIRRPGLVLTRTMIAEHVWDFAIDLASNVVDVYVKHLRRKLDEPGKPSLIQTVRRVGYTLRDPDVVEG